MVGESVGGIEGNDVLGAPVWVEPLTNVGYAVDGARVGETEGVVVGATVGTSVGVTVGGYVGDTEGCAVFHLARYFRRRLISGAFIPISLSSASVASLSPSHSSYPA